MRKSLRMLVVLLGTVILAAGILSFLAPISRILTGAIIAVGTALCVIGAWFLE